MRVTYLAHSGFLIELSAVSLLFDWWKGSLPPLPEGKPLLVYEEVAGIGGLGSLLQQVAAGQESRTPVHSLALPDRWIYHGKRRELLRRMGLDAAGLRKTVRELLGR